MLRRFVILDKTDDDVFGAYIHLCGTIGALTVVEGTDDEEFAKDIAMHIAAASPQFVSREDVDKDLVDQEREVLKQQALNEGKPENIVERMVEGRDRKSVV